MRSALY